MRRKDRKFIAWFTLVGLFVCVTSGCTTSAQRMEQHYPVMAPGSAKGITATGYAVVSTQPGQNVEQKRLMAIRAARMAAMRDLAEQIHGLQVDSNTTVVDLMVQNDTFRGVVTGTIRGARTVRINPTGADTYEIVLEIDREMMTYLLNVARQA